MRIVIADCSVIYTGRGDTKMFRAVRSIIVKSDGAVSIHNDFGNKPLNYMGKDNMLTESTNEDGTLIWYFENRKENLTVYIHRLLSDSNYTLDNNDEGLVRDGTEHQLQEWLSDNPSALGEDYTFVAREVQTGNGPVDLLVKDSEGNHIAVEVKRVAMLSAVDQVRRYVSALNETAEYGIVRGILAALDVRPKTLALADKRGIQCVTLSSAWNDREMNMGSVEAASVEEIETVRCTGIGAGSLPSFV